MIFSTKPSKANLWLTYALLTLTFVVNVVAFSLAIAAYAANDAKTSDKLSKISQIIVTGCLCLISLAMLKRTFGGLFFE